jgi:hypothetical protein
MLLFAVMATIAVMGPVSLLALPAFLLVLLLAVSVLSLGRRR